MRSYVRKLRFFYKPVARARYKKNFRSYWHAFFYPFFGESNFEFCDGEQIHIPRKHWSMLATTCRLKELGARLRWHDDAMEIAFRGLTFFGPPDSRLMSLEMEGIVAGDVWRADYPNLSGKTVIDVGSHAGVFAVTCAKFGAKVHAFEPFAEFANFIRRNIRANDVADRVTVHEVGLSASDEQISDPARLRVMAGISHGGGDLHHNNQVRIVNAIDYFTKHNIRSAHLLKMNCEGCEYELFRNSEIIDFLSPERISMEYHNGGHGIFQFLTSKGYIVDWPAKNAGGTGEGKGQMFAGKASSEGRSDTT